MVKVKGSSPFHCHANATWTRVSHSHLLPGARPMTVSFRHLFNLVSSWLAHPVRITSQPRPWPPAASSLGLAQGRGKRLALPVLPSRRAVGGSAIDERGRRRLGDWRWRRLHESARLDPHVWSGLSKTARGHDRCRRNLTFSKMRCDNFSNHVNRAYRRIGGPPWPLCQVKEG